MSFGFPAYHEDSFQLEVDRYGSREAIRDAFEDLGWEFLEQDDGSFIAIVSRPRWEGRSRFTVEVDDFGEMKVRSQNWLFTQCFDGGQNARNVHAFASKVLGKTHRKSAIDNAYPERKPENLAAGDISPVEKLINDKGV